MNLKIGGIKYRVAYVKDLRDSKDNTKLNGQIIWDACRVDIDKGLSVQRQNQVIVHEVFHGILDDYCVDDVENIVRRLGHGIYEFIIKNPKFIRGIIEHDESLKK